VNTWVYYSAQDLKEFVMLMFRIKHFPELLLVKDREEQKSIMRSATKKCGNNPRVVGGVLLFALLGSAILFSAKPIQFVINPFLGDFATELLVKVVSLNVALYVSFFLMIEPTIRKKIREELVLRGIPICVACGYCLRGLSVARCPECGAPFTSEEKEGGTRR